MASWRRGSSNAMGIPPEVVERARLWGHALVCEVSPLWVCHGVSITFQRHWNARGWPRLWVLKTVVRISRFVQLCGSTELPFAAYAIHRVSPSALQPLHRAVRARSKRADPLLVSQVGDVVRWQGKLVEVERMIRSVDASAVSTSLEMVRWFAMGSGHNARCAWAAVRVHHRCRHLIAPDACCESLGSLMRHLWSSRRGLTPVQHADSVFLSQACAHCIGGARDEALVAKVADALQSTCKFRMRPSAVVNVPFHARELEERLQMSGRMCGALAVSVPMELSTVTSARARRACLSQRSKLSWPTTLPPEMVAAIDGCKDSAGQIAPLALDVRHLHAQQRGATMSVGRERVKGWLSSDAGQSWVQDQAKLTQADDGGQATMTGEEPASSQPAPKKRKRG